MWEAIAAITAVAVAIGALLLAVAKLGFWIRDMFSDFSRKFYSEMEKSRTLNQERHEENLKSFEAIRLALARAGFWNGK